MHYRWHLLLICSVIAALRGSVSAQVFSATVLTAEEKAKGWKLLFDGTAATGFRGLQKPDFLKAGWSIGRGELQLPKDLDKMGKVTGGDLVTTEQFEDFEFSFEWKLSVSANTGVRYLARRGAGGSPTGFEYQIIDDVHHPEGLKGGPIRRTGALDGLIAPIENKRLNGPGEWNQGRIVLQGAHVEHWLNGQRVVEFDLGSAPLMAAAQAAKIKPWQGFGTKFKSPLVLLDQGDEVAFRALKIRSLPAATAAGAPAPAVMTPPSPGAPQRTPATPAVRPPAGLPPTPPDLR